MLERIVLFDSVQPKIGKLIDHGYEYGGLVLSRIDNLRRIKNEEEFRGNEVKFINVLRINGYREPLNQVGLFVKKRKINLV